jgi:ankyrin repeat protein
MPSPEDLLQALRDGRLERVRELLDADPALAWVRDPEGVSALMHARYRQRFDLVELLLEHRRGELDLFEAAALGRFERLELVLSREPRAVSAFSPDGFTALHLAAFFAEAACARALLQRGADAEAVARNAMGVRPLHSAVAGGSKEIVDLLLARGADPEARQRGGWTPLHAAAAAGRVDIAQALLQRGAGPDTHNDEGKSPLDLARASNRPAVIQVLERARPRGGQAPQDAP